MKGGEYILYWMQASHRTLYNAALQYAIRMGNRHRLPVIAYFGLTEHYPGGNERHYRFLLEGLAEVRRGLEEMGIPFVLQQVAPAEGAVVLSKDALMVITDMAYQRIARDWTGIASGQITCPLLQVEDNVTVPVRIASPKEEYSAATFRPKISALLPRFLVPCQEEIPIREVRGSDMETLAEESIGALLSRLGIDRSVGSVDAFQGGTSQALERFTTFLDKKLDGYPEDRNDPIQQATSNLSPYLHFGQVSPLYLALKVQETESPGKAPFLEELIVRRELAINYVFYNSANDSFQGVPRWAQETLMVHRKDPRPYEYTLEDLEGARTHDPAWNACQNEMRVTGKMHGYMRMYWGKKILEWTAEPEDAFRRAVFLNDRYELDGRDPNGYAGVA
jgi:deoxyribodipyrimidine photo-lyase